jgi:YVTN family beta-propeller protein
LTGRTVPGAATQGLRNGYTRGRFAHLRDVALEFRLLGPVEVVSGGSPLPLGGPKQRSLLALLLLHAGEPVSRDTLVDALWGERPPASAVTALHGYVSQLRKAIEPERSAGAAPSVLVTVDPGYALRVVAEQVDAERFRQLAAQGRAAVGDPEAAARVLGEALAIWRGPALADLADEPYLAAHAARLDEERAAALEDRIDADLALGRHAELVGELEAIVAASPLRERPRAQLMLALYRCGRQADALAAYRDARRTLVEEVGIEPGAALRELERRVLEQDPALDLEKPARPPPSLRSRPPAKRRRRRLAAAALATSTAAVIAAAALLSAQPNHEARAVAVTGNSVAAIDPDTNRVVADIAVGGTPTAIAAGEGAVWVLNADDQTVSRIDTATQGIKTFGTGGVPTDVAVGEGGLWVGNGRRGGAQFVGPSATSVSHFDTSTNGLRASVSLPRRNRERLNTNSDHLAVGAGAVWAVGPDFSISRIDPGTTEIAGHAGSLQFEAVAAGPEGVWARDGRGRLERLDRAGQRIAIKAGNLAGLAVGEGAVWVTAPYDGKLWRVDSEQQLVARPIEVGEGTSAVAAGGGSVWVANALRGTVSRVDPRTNRVTARIDVGGTPRRLVVSGERVWVTVAGSAGDRSAAPRAASAGGGLPAAACGQVFYGGGGTPDKLIVSDMPLRGGPALPTRQMSDAIAYVLRERDFRAGRFRVAYQSCDDSTEQTGIFDEQKCAANAKAFAANELVIGEVGPYNSGCARVQIPIAARAPGGPLAMAGLNSAVGLTRPSTDTTEADVAALYPAGRRNFARVTPDEAAQGAAGAIEARALGARSAFVLRDNGYGTQTSTSFLRAAERLRLKVAGVREWQPGRRTYSSLAAAVARARPGAVYVAGLLDSGGGQVIADVRRAVGPGVPILAGDGLLPISGLFHAAGPAARDVRVSLPGLTTDRLPPAGRHFASQFGATQPGGRVGEAAVYAAAATNIMLDAIARSDGTRASVTAAMLRTPVRGGILGGFRFDENGDPSSSPITILRARRVGGSDEVQSHEGATVERVVRPRAGLGE